MALLTLEKLKTSIRDVPDFPKPGVLFKDITPLLQNPELFKTTIERLSGPLAFRFILQPIMSTALAVRDGVHDAHQGSPPYLWSIVFDSGSKS